MATLYQRNGTYYVNYAVNGRRVRRSVGSDRREAKIRLSELQCKLSEGDIRPDRPEMPFDIFWDRYLANCASRLAQGTVIRYKNAIKHFRLFFTKRHPLQFISQLGKAGLQEYVSCRQSCKPRPKAKTINNELTVLRAAFNWAVENDWLERSPALTMKLLKTVDSKQG